MARAKIDKPAATTQLSINIVFVNFSFWIPDRLLSRSNWVVCSNTKKNVNQPNVTSKTCNILSLETRNKEEEKSQTTLNSLILVGSRINMTSVSSEFDNNWSDLTTKDVKLWFCWIVCWFLFSTGNFSWNLSCYIEEFLRNCIV